MSEVRSDTVALPPRDALLTCLRSDAWADALLGGAPYPTRTALEEAALRAARDLDDDALDQALAAHPRIGDRPQGDGVEAAHSRREQSGVSDDDPLAARLRETVRAYEERFDRVFLVRAAGRSTSDLLALARQRLGHDRSLEDVVVREQLGEIAVLRLRPLVEEPA
ncbi:2-oxo-4-hydroxy-4-carboxy-5-ureidoimidazoline decarboxylase [Aquipuribacter nitratireducens]|uniref:2-oxo-4-hydroxy-4-carboxy-5-ureidoimidazoline decarboxylase n=1 Tax=Aquipuribacter nitratireducens TaxID=650104 RepID=A0ABW0GSR8_9MICO